MTRRQLSDTMGSMNGRWSNVILLIPVLCLIPLFFILPGVRSSLFLSPDETAVAVASHVYQTSQTFAISDPWLAVYPWMHPRSFVTQGASLVPVGFLGAPALFSWVVRAFGEWSLLFFAPILVLSVCVPLWDVGRRWGLWGRIGTVLTWMTFPTVLLYANRGLFPNVFVVCFVVWALWILARQRDIRHRAVRIAACIVAGGLLGMAIFIRPIELVWMMPLMGVALWQMMHVERSARTRWFELGCVLVPLVGVLAYAVSLHVLTYGGFRIGYQLHDPVVMNATSTVTRAATSWFHTWPFGFHPRNVWFNVSSYLGGFLWPWTVFLLSGLVLAFRDRQIRAWWWAALWVIAALPLMYGQGIYQDSVRINVATLANSFMRYLLPLAPLMALGVGCTLQAVSKIKQLPVLREVLAMIMLLAVMFFGVWSATMRDDESLLADRNELLRYESIRTQTMELFPEKPVIVLSDRSDKIFFPVFRSATPVPKYEEIVALVDAHPEYAVLLFTRVLEPSTIGPWLTHDLYPQELFQAGNEAMYLLSPTP